MIRPAKLRCAIYTRKSSEEGLEQAFNSLHAQREACEAYVRSQLGEGWSLIKTAYDDGGFSGGSIDRPALKALMAEVEAGRIDVVVVYKVDRLTRSLMDFSRIVEAFDRKGVSFVSVTQAFNTTTSMGRLTLNVLLSFAQFEREVTGERIRDKIAASKAKGMWMGGVPALGYDVKDRALVINPSEAAVVVMAFRGYLELGSVHALQAEFDAKSMRSKAWVSRGGLPKGGEPFSRGALFHLLGNRLYVGEITHKDLTYPGLHAAIVDRTLFDQVQTRLGANSRKRRGRTTKASMAPLVGRIFDHDGCPMSPTFANGKNGRSYRYYVSTTLQQGRTAIAGDDVVRRVSAPQLEALIADRLARMFGGERADVWGKIGDQLQRIEVRSHAVHVVVASAALLRGHGRLASALDVIAAKLERDDQLLIEPDQRLRLIISARPVFRGGRTWLVTTQGAAAVRKIQSDPALINMLRKAHTLLEAHGTSAIDPAVTEREATSPKDSFARKTAQLAFLAPDIQLAIVEGRQPPGLTVQQLLDRDIPLAWADQRAALGFP